MQDSKHIACSDSVTSVLSRSWGLTPYVDATKDCQNDGKFNRQNVREQSSQLPPRDLKPFQEELSVLTCPNSITWCDTNGERHHISVENSVYDRLLRDCNPNSFLWLHPYIRSKWENVERMRYPYIVSPDFYLLWKEICGVTHELFADSINASGVLPKFCSVDTEDKRFGACGSWEDVEDIVDGGVGHPPFDNDFLKKLLIRMEVNVRKNRAYCRVLLLPYNENGVLRRLIDSEDVDHEGEVLAVIDKGLFRFRHQRELFESRSRKISPSIHEYSSNDVDMSIPPSNRREPQVFTHGSSSVQMALRHNTCDADWVYESPIALVIWINENYRNRYPAPNDVEDILLHWVVGNFGPIADSVLDMDAIDRAFPDRTRSGERKADIFAV